MHSSRRPDSRRATARPRRARARVAPRVEHDLGGREHRALAVDMDGAALEDEGRGEAPRPEQVEDPPGHVARATVLLVDAAVGVEAPVHAGESAAPVGDEGRRGVARPRVVAGDGDHVGAGDAGERTAGAPASSALAVIVTGSKRATARATSAYVARAFSMSSQFSGRHGQAIQQPACGAHSGGMRKPASRGVFTATSRVVTSIDRHAVPGRDCLRRPGRGKR